MNDRALISDYIKILQKLSSHLFVSDTHLTQFVKLSKNSLIKKIRILNDRGFMIRNFFFKGNCNEKVRYYYLERGQGCVL